MTTTTVASRMRLSEDDIAAFLVNTPDFFERYAEVLASVTLTSPHGQRAVSLYERQAAMLRERIKLLEQRIREMVRNASDNAVIAHKLHQWTCALSMVQDAAALPQAVEQGMRTIFAVPQVALRVWDIAPVYDTASFTADVSRDMRSFASSLTAPYCGPNRGFEATAWLSDASQVQSLAPLPLRAHLPPEASDIGMLQPAFGLLVLGAQDPQRFDANMGTDLLARMAELAGAVLSRLQSSHAPSEDFPGTQGL